MSMMNNGNFAKNVTQGGQVATYMIRMFVQINNIITYYLIMLFMFVLSLSVYLRLSWQTIHNSIIYFWAQYGGKFFVKQNTIFEIIYYDQKLKYSAKNLLTDPFVLYSKDLFLKELWVIGGVSFILTSVIAGLAYYVINRLGKKQSMDDFVSGRLLNDNPKSVAKIMKSRKENSDIKIDALPIKKDSEIQNIAMVGTIGTGKSTIINKYLEQLKKRGDKVIIYDKGCTFVEKFYNPSVDKLLNPLDERCENWDLWGECSSQPDYDTIASTLIPMPGNGGGDPFWQGSSRTIFSAAASRMKADNNRSYTKLLKTLLAIDLKSLRNYLKGTEAASLVEEKIEKNGHFN